jgi:hypothetical protein
LEAVPELRLQAIELVVELSRETVSATDLVEMQGDVEAALVELDHYIQGTTGIINRCQWNLQPIPCQGLPTGF